MKPSHSQIKVATKETPGRFQLLCIAVNFSLQLEWPFWIYGSSFGLLYFYYQLYFSGLSTIKKRKIL